MTSTPPVPPDADDKAEYLRIADVSAALGVPIPTLRSWELRYGLPIPRRTTGRHRRYTDDDLNMLRLMRDEISRGLRAGDALVSVQRLRSRLPPSGPYVDQLLAATQSAQPAEMLAILQRAQHTLGLPVAMDDVLWPTLRQVGRWWETGLCESETEAALTTASRTWLKQVRAVPHPPSHACRVALCAGPGERHTLGIEAFGTLLRDAGCETVFTTPSHEQAADFGAIVVVAHLPSARRRASTLIGDLAKAGGNLYYAGSAFQNATSRARVPGSYLGQSLGAAADIVTNDLLSSIEVAPSA